MTPFPLIGFTAEEITDCTNETVRGANKARKNQPSCFIFISFLFTTLVTP